MEDGAIIVAQVISEGMLQESLNKLIAGIGGAAVAWYIRKKYYERQDKTDKLEKTYRALFGVDDMDTMEGVVEIIEAHEDDIEELYTEVENGKKKRKEIDRKVTTIREKIKNRHGNNTSGNNHDTQ